jgi:GNAT superfamily N-acetyltransferase
VADGIAFVHALAVPEAFRRKGAARNMMQRAAVWARDAGAGWLGLAVTRANGAGNGLYTSLGMTIVEQYHYRILPKAKA